MQVPRAHHVEEVRLDESVGELCQIPLPHFWLVAEGVTLAAQVGGVGGEVGVEALQEAIRPAVVTEIWVALLRHGCCQITSDVCPLCCDRLCGWGLVRGS